MHGKRQSALEARKQVADHHPVTDHHTRARPMVVAHASIGVPTTARARGPYELPGRSALELTQAWPHGNDQGWLTMRFWAAFNIVVGMIILGAALVLAMAIGACDNECPDPTPLLLALVVPRAGLLFIGLRQVDLIRGESTEGKWPHRRRRPR
jgi:hypothetical protein